jgi:hypothetical protein
MKEVRPLPVLLIVFNRPEKTRQVLDKLATIEGVEVQVFHDGPRSYGDPDNRRTQVRDVIAEFEGGVVREYLELSENAGCALGVATALKWFFSTFSEGIVLEDDCVPTAEFVSYCRIALDRYRDDFRVGSIGGQGYSRPAGADPRRSVLVRYPQIWGWASWRDRMEGYTLWLPREKTSVRTTTYWSELTVLEQRDWRRTFKRVSVDRPHTWDAQLVHHHWVNQYLSLLPPVSLVANIGFDAEATHTRAGAPTWVQALGSPEERREAVDWLARDDSQPSRDVGIDQWMSRNIYSPSVTQRIRHRLSMTP